ncbi:MAG TPA: LacI family DNA-binding transcriptional regulator [Bacteroidota bacterium]|nr:LacI family DNA-binding transcriptional regulator [Bacteroidota bacterium]
MKIITQKDLADKLGVSRITVSKALSNSSDISLEMREKVKLLAQEMGYIPDYTARNLHRSRTNTIGVVVPDVANSFFSFAIDGIMDAAVKHGYHVMLTVSRENASIEIENIITMLAHRVDGILVAVSKETTDRAIFERVKKRNVPIIFFDRAIQGIGISSVGIDDRLATSTLLTYAIECGYKHIAHLAGSQKIRIGRERQAGYIETLQKYNLPVKDDWIIYGGFDKVSGYHGCRKLLEQDPLPELIFASNDRIAQGAYEAIKRAGLKIPLDIGVIALGHREFAELLSPTLTIIDSSPYVLGQKAMEVLVDEMRGSAPKGVHHHLIETVLRQNESLLPRVLNHSSHQT